MKDSGLSESAVEGCYAAARAAALSGVPKTTVYWWARHGIVEPSVSRTQTMLWSYADLISLRVVSWLRHPKWTDTGADLPASPMAEVRRALRLLDDLGLDPWRASDAEASPLAVDRAGQIYVRISGGAGGVVNVYGQPALPSSDALDLTAPFRDAGMAGPDLIRPRPHLRIIPARVAGEPHVENTRLTTQTIAALAARGYDAAAIAGMYQQSEATMLEAIDLERQLSVDDSVAA